MNLDLISVLICVKVFMYNAWLCLYKIFWRCSEALGVVWAPKNIPFSRRLQTLAAAGWITLIVFGEGISIFLFIQLLYSSYWWLALLYSVWMMKTIEVPSRGGFRLEWVRNWAWWRYYRDYFPLKMVKTADLDPKRNYLLACFPHGVICAGIFGAFATNALGFYDLFPGTTCNVISLGGHFLVPFFRDLFMAIGGCSSSAESLMYLLDPKRYKGNCVALPVGGAAEALEAHPGEYRIVLKRRKGFVRIALKTGSPIVPVFAFGETDVFRPMENPKDSLLRRFQDKVRELTGLSPIVPLGRGIFQYSYGIIPFRRPVTIVVGAPIEVTRNLDPTEEEVETVLSLFTGKLIELFENEKSKYIENYENTKLIII